MWEIIGYEEQVRDDGSASYTIYSAKDMKTDNGCYGRKVRRDWYKVDQVHYVPKIGDLVIIETELRGKYQVVVDIWVP